MAEFFDAEDLPDILAGLDAILELARQIEYLTRKFDEDGENRMSQHKRSAPAIFSVDRYDRHTQRHI